MDKNIFLPPPENGKWLNIKTNKIRIGHWEYLRGMDRFRIKIKGLSLKIIDGDSPEYGDWILQRN